MARLVALSAIEDRVEASKDESFWLGGEPEGWSGEATTDVDVVVLDMAGRGGRGRKTEDGGRSWVLILRKTQMHY